MTVVRMVDPDRNPVKFVPADQRSDGGRSSFLGGAPIPKKLDGGGAGVCSIQGARGVPMGFQGWRQTWTDVANGGHDGVCGERAGQTRYPRKQWGMGVGVANDRDGAMVGARSKHTLELIIEGRHSILAHGQKSPIYKALFKPVGAPLYRKKT